MTHLTFSMVFFAFTALSHIVPLFVQLYEKVGSGGGKNIFISSTFNETKTVIDISKYGTLLSDNEVLKETGLLPSTVMLEANRQHEAKSFQLVTLELVTLDHFLEMCDDITTDEISVENRSLAVISLNTLQPPSELDTLSVIILTSIYSFIVLFGTVALVGRCYRASFDIVDLVVDEVRVALCNETLDESSEDKGENCADEDWVLIDETTDSDELTAFDPPREETFDEEGDSGGNFTDTYVSLCARQTEAAGGLLTLYPSYNVEVDSSDTLSSYSGGGTSGTDSTGSTTSTSITSSTIPSSASRECGVYTDTHNCCASCVDVDCYNAASEVATVDSAVDSSDDNITHSAYQISPAATTATPPRVSESVAIRAAVSDCAYESDCSEEQQQQQCAQVDTTSSCILATAAEPLQQTGDQQPAEEQHQSEPQLLTGEQAAKQHHLPSLEVTVAMLDTSLLVVENHFPDFYTVAQ